MTVTLAPASRKAAAAPNPMLLNYQYGDLRWGVMFVHGVSGDTDPEVPPTTMIFLFTSLSADLTMLTAAMTVRSKGRMERSLRLLVRQRGFIKTSGEWSWDGRIE
jgi:hypothetical protein